MEKSLKLISVLLFAIIMLTLAAMPTMAMPANNYYDNDFQNQQNEWLQEQQQQQQDYFEDFAETQNEIYHQANRRIDGFRVFVIVCIVLAVILLIAEITYILIEAPKCGMSRLWALVPLFSNIIGLLVFIVVRSGVKQNNTLNAVTCPVCTAKHPNGIDTCTVCGAKLR